MDALSDLLRVVRLSGGVFLDAEFSAPWSITAQVGPEDCRLAMAEPARLIAFHYVISGNLLLQIDRDPPVEVRGGTIVLLPRNDEKVLAGWENDYRDILAWIESLEAVLNGSLDMEAMISHRFPLSEAPSVFTRIGDRSLSHRKIIFYPGDRAS